MSMVLFSFTGRFLALTLLSPASRPLCSHRPRSRHHRLATVAAGRRISTAARACRPTPAAGTCFPAPLAAVRDRRSRWPCTECSSRLSSRKPSRIGGESFEQMDSLLTPETFDYTEHEVVCLQTKFGLFRCFTQFRLCGWQKMECKSASCWMNKSEAGIGWWSSSSSS